MPRELVTAGTSGDIQVISRSAQLLRLFSATRRSLRVADVSTELGLQRTTVHRYLTSLANAGFLDRDSDGSFRLGPLLVQLGTVALRGLRVLEAAGPHAQQLADEANETAVLAVWGGQGAVVARVHDPNDRIVNISVRVGAALPLEAAQSQVFLAFLRDPHLVQRLVAQLPAAQREHLRSEIEQVRHRGYVVNSQVVQGIRAIAAPVFDAHGEIAATIAILGTVNGIPEAGRSGLLLALLGTAERISRTLGYTNHMPFAEQLQPGENVS
jgi:DNA-binding IclR family transcriptional regulator